MGSLNFTIRPIIHSVVFPAVIGLVGMQFGCDTVRSWETRPTSMTSASDVPASEGTVKATLGANGNTNLYVRVKHLAPAFKVRPDATVYIVWLQRPGEAIQNIGALTLTDNLEGNLNTETPYRRFTITITPEPNRQVEQPTHEPVFKSEVTRDG